MQTPEVALDQADGLRRIVSAKPVKVIAVSSGKGGVGKTNISVNLSVSLAKLGREVMLMDADLGLANVDVLLGLNPSYDLSHVISGERTLEEVVVEGPANLKIIPASSGISKMANLQSMEQAGLIQAFSELGYALDVLVVDTGAGIADGVVNFCSAAQEVVVVVCDEPASITDAYAFIKVMSREHGIDHFQILANMAHTNSEGREMFHKLSTAAERFLDVMLTFMGSIPYDPRLRKAVQHQRAVVEAFPRCPAAQAMTRLARQVDEWPEAAGSGGQLEFFIERLIHADTDMSEA
ncbi:MAG TPA: MinD/ParA family protein [Thiotrichales bacterium]|nr:MinD/ParA family protein [Thiotrichales bacterium]